MAQALTAADRTPEPGDEILTVSGLPGTVKYVSYRQAAIGEMVPLFLTLGRPGKAQRLYIWPSHWSRCRYVSRADGGPVTKD